MFTVELTLKSSPIALSVQRKEQAAAEEVYKSILQAMRNSSQNPILELTCEKQPEKKIAIITNELSAVQISDKTGAAVSTGVGFARN